MTEAHIFDTERFSPWVLNKLRTVYFYKICPHIHIYTQIFIHMGFPDGSMVKNPPVKTGDSGSIPGFGRSPRVGNSNPLQILAWEIPWTEEPGRLQSIGSKRVAQ